MFFRISVDIFRVLIAKSEANKYKIQRIIRLVINLKKLIFSILLKRVRYIITWKQKRNIFQSETINPMIYKFINDKVQDDEIKISTWKQYQK